MILTVIPSRLNAQRLPRKPLADIGGVPMVVRVLRAALEADLGRVVVATDSQEIADVVTEAGGEFVMTDPHLPSGTDRMAAALSHIDPNEAYQTAINLQCDLPFFHGADLRVASALLDDPSVDIATLAAVITDDAEVQTPSVVKIAGTEVSQNRYRALYFSRSPIPYGESLKFHHIGVYAFRRTALRRFVTLSPSPLELSEKLEQLRALEAGMRIDVSIVNSAPLSIDTPQDLEKARSLV